jgi:hypothetical protein
MTLEEKNRILTGKNVEVALFKTAADDCEEIIFENVRVRILKCNRYSEANELWAKDDWTGFIQLCVNKDKDWIARLHPNSESELLDACKEVNAKGFFKRQAEIAAEKKKYLEDMNLETIQKLEAIGRRASQTESQK